MRISNDSSDDLLAFDIVLHPIHDGWEKSFKTEHNYAPDDMQRWIEAVANMTLDHAEFPAALKDFDGFEMAIVLADDDTVREMNKSYRGKDQPTNVLSFATLDKIEKQEIEAIVKSHEWFALGDVVLAYETCFKEAESQAVPFKNHVAHLVIHGILHLLGYDHENDNDAVRMEGLETKILEILGIDNPYRHNTIENDDE